MTKKILLFFIVFLPSCNIFDTEQRLLNRGLKSLTRQDYASAIQYFSKSLQLNNLNYNALKMRGIAYGLELKYDSALIDISRSNSINSMLSNDDLEERFTICEDSYFLGMMNYYLQRDEEALKYLKYSISFNPMELINWNEAIEKKISKDFKFEYDYNYTSLYLESLILCSKLCMETNRTNEAFYFLYKAKEVYDLEKAPYLLLKQITLSVGDSIGAEKFIKEYDTLMKTIETEDLYALTKIQLETNRMLQDLNRKSYEEDRWKISYGIIQKLKNQNPRFDIDSIYLISF